MMIQKTFQIFGVLIGNAKITRKLKFHPAAPVIKYHQKTYNSCCLISLASSFNCINYNRAVPDRLNSIEEPLTLEKKKLQEYNSFCQCYYVKQKKKKG